MSVLAALSMLNGLDGFGWDPELMRRKAENDARDRANDPYCDIRKRFPEFRYLDFPAEAQLIRDKKSKFSANDRAYILRMVEKVEGERTDARV